jgi:hypothetical protein
MILKFLLMLQSTKYVNTVDLMREVFFNSLPQHDVLFSHFVSNFNVYSKRQSIW